MIQIYFIEFKFGFDSIKDMLDVVLVPLILGIFGLLIPQLWDKRKRNSDTKTKLVTEISEIVMTTVMSLHLTKNSQADNSKPIEGSLDEIYKRWMVETCVIGSKLHAYFPNPEKGEEQIHRKWHIFSDHLSEYYKTNRIKENITDLDYFKKEREILFKEKASIIAEILTSKITGFRHKDQL